ncbi:hypothetical protein SAMN05216436_104227 [bacterium A37T11]|nr:hypothetical protein SAMN05216436_104227 [bacterium A37T11]
MRPVINRIRENRPCRLNDQELSKPSLVFENFFKSGDPNYWKHTLWGWLSSQLTDGFIMPQLFVTDKMAPFPQAHYQLARMVEAAWVKQNEQAIHRLRFNGEEIKRLMSATIQLQSKPKFYEVNEKLYTFYFLNVDERRIPDLVLQNTFLIYDLYDWQTILEEWLVYGRLNFIQAAYTNKSVILYVYVQLNKLVEAVFLLHHSSK